MSSSALKFVPTSPLSHPSPSIKPNPQSSLFFPRQQLLSNSNNNGGLLKEELFLHPNSLDLPLPHPVPPYRTQSEEEEDIGSYIVENGQCLSELSSWGIGGPCKYFLKVSQPSQLAAAVQYRRSRSIDFIIIGNGSNCLFSDRRYNGLVILNRLINVEVISPGTYSVGSGYPFNRLGLQCSNAGFSGLEFAGGVPGTVGGAAFMNAGADGQEISNVIDSVDIVTLDGKFQKLRRIQLAFGYRWSSFQEMVGLAAITAVTFKLMPSTTARKQQRTFLRRRKMTQPIREKTAGSVFKNSTGFEISAGELIELAGLKGYEFGGARVSSVHGNFFVNFDCSTSWEMLALINIVKERVFQLFGIELKEEIKFVPSRSQII